MRYTWCVRVCESESLFAKHVRQRTTLQNKKSKCICLLEASQEGPRVHVFRHDRRSLGWSTTRIKAETNSAATVLTTIAGAWNKAIPVRKFRCAVSQDISTNWHPKMCDQNNELMKAEEALQATSRPALTTFCTILEAGMR